MSFFDPENVKAVLSGRWLRQPNSGADASQQPPVGVGIDTREELTGRIFIAIKGPTHDGHAFLNAAVESGARTLIIDDARYAGNLKLSAAIGVLCVKNTRHALATLAHAYRKTLVNTVVIAVTGSSGKTTTKRLIESVLRTTLRGTAAPKSFNNDIGVPLTLLAAQPHDQFLVCEVGTNAPGEIAQLAAIVTPDIAIITSIGHAHLQGLGSIDGVAREKASILAHLKKDAVAIINADSAALRPYLDLAPPTASRIFFGQSEDADVRLTARGADKSIWWFEVNDGAGRRFPLGLPGKHNALNALAAVAVARRLGLDDEAISAGFAAVKPAAMRMAAQQIGDVTIYNDAYNANPDSVIAALETFAEVAADAARRIVVLGDMLELGEAGPQMHREVGRQLLELDQQVRIDYAIFVGELSAFAAAEVSRQWSGERIAVFNQADEAADSAIASLLSPGDAVLLKASRGMGLERIVAAIEQTSKRQNVKTSKEERLKV